MHKRFKSAQKNWRKLTKPLCIKRGPGSKRTDGPEGPDAELSTRRTTAWTSCNLASSALREASTVSPECFRSRSRSLQAGCAGPVRACLCRGEPARPKGFAAEDKSQERSRTLDHCQVGITTEHIRTESRSQGGACDWKATSEHANARQERVFAAEASVKRKRALNLRDPATATVTMPFMSRSFGDLVQNYTLTGNYWLTGPGDRDNRLLHRVRGICIPEPGLQAAVAHDQVEHPLTTSPVQAEGSCSHSSSPPESSKQTRCCMALASPALEGNLADVSSDSLVRLRCRHSLDLGLSPWLCSCLDSCQRM